MTDFSDKPSAPSAVSIDWDNSPSILNDQRKENINKFFNVIKSKSQKYNKTCKKKYKTLQILKLIDLSCFSLETPVVCTSVFIPVIAPFTVPILLGTTVLHLILKSITNKITKDLMLSNANNAMTTQIYEQFLEFLEQASEDGIITEDEFNEIYKIYKRYFNLLN